MKRRWRIALCLLVAVVVAPLLGAVIPRPLFDDPSDDSISARRRVLVLANPIHTDIAFPAAEDVLARFGFLAGAGLPITDPAVKWIIVGWGGREFYLETPTWADLKPMPVLRGVTIDRSVMHVSVGGAIDETNPSVLALDVSPQHFERMMEAALAGFSKSADGAPRLIEGRSYGPYDRFYEAEGIFSALRGCNTWTGAVLREGGLRTGLWNPLPQSLLWSVKLFNGPPQIATP